MAWDAKRFFAIKARHEQEPRDDGALARTDEELKLPAGANLRLAVIEGPDKGLRILFTKGNMLIGKGGADVVLHDEMLSRRHAVIEAYTRDKVFIKDLASSSGTLVNGEKVTYGRLKSGDQVKVGTSLLRFEIEDA